MQSEIRVQIVFDPVHSIHTAREHQFALQSAMRVLCDAGLSADVGQDTLDVTGEGPLTNPLTVMTMHACLVHSGCSDAAATISDDAVVDRLTEQIKELEALVLAMGQEKMQLQLKCADLKARLNVVAASVAKTVKIIDRIEANKK